MAITLGHNQYGKAETRVVRVFRDTEPHEIADYNVSVALVGDFDDVHYSGDNTKCLTTDATKNTVNAFAKEAGDAVREPESFGIALAKHFVDDVPQVSRARIQIEAYPWDRLSHNGSPHPHAFARRGSYVRTVTVTYDGSAAVGGVRRARPDRAQDDGLGVPHLLPGALHDAASRRTTGSWRRRSPRSGCTPSTDTDWGTSYDRVLATLGEHLRRPPQPRAAADALRDGRGHHHEQPEIAEIRFSMPNKHHFLVDLSPFDLENKNEVFHADDRPYGYIEGTVRRDDAPNPGPAAFDPGQGW